MSVDIWENAVETYLAKDRGLFLSPQYLVGEQGVWEGSPDFLAIIFPESQIWMVEVTVRPASKLLNKLMTFEAEYKPRIRAQLEAHKVINGTNWTIDLWLFLPEEEIERFKTKLMNNKCLEPRFTALEETVKPSVLGARYRA